MRKILLLIFLIALLIGGVYVWQNYFSLRTITNRADKITSAAYRQAVNFAEYKEIDFPNFTLNYVGKKEWENGLTSFIFVVPGDKGEPEEFVIRAIDSDSVLSGPSLVSAAEQVINGRKYRFDIQNRQLAVWPLDE